MASKTSQTNGNKTTETLPELHARLIGEYATTSGATKARVSKGIADAEYAMELQDIEYEPWVKPSTVTTKWVLTEPGSTA